VTDFFSSLISSETSYAQSGVNFLRVQLISVLADFVGFAFSCGFSIQILSQILILNSPDSFGGVPLKLQIFQKLEKSFFASCKSNCKYSRFLEGFTCSLKSLVDLVVVIEIHHQELQRQCHQSCQNLWHPHLNHVPKNAQYAWKNLQGNV